MKDVQNQEQITNDINWLKLGVWLYFYLLIFEGALRKWFLPGLSDVLLIIRDPLALVLIFFTWKSGLLKLNIFVLGMTIIAFIGIITTLFVGHQNLAVTLYGARILLIQFPFVFVIGAVFNKNDVLKLGKHMLWIAIPMTILIALQFYSPQSAWVNRGVGGDMEGAGFSGALGFFRPPGTFSFTNGNTFFYSFLACFILIFYLNHNRVNKILLICATMCLAMAIPLSISRTLLFSVIIALLFYFGALYYRPDFLKKLTIFLIILTLVGIVVLNLEFVDTATEAFGSRIENASESEGGLEGSLINRYLGGYIDAIVNTKNIPFFGYGIGMGTNVGSHLLSGEREFLIAEEEWARTIGEMGMLLGLGVILLRVLFSWVVTIKSFQQVKNQNFVPWMLLSFVLLIFPQGQWAQPTALGFAVLSSGFLIAALNDKKIII